MTIRRQVTCIHKDHINPHERIESIGGIDGSHSWIMSEKDAISYIDNKQYSFFVFVGHRSVDLVVDERKGQKYLKTQEDGYIPDNLLSLPECP